MSPKLNPFLFLEPLSKCHLVVLKTLAILFLGTSTFANPTAVDTTSDFLIQYSLSGGSQTSNMILPTGYHFQTIAIRDETYQPSNSIRGKFDFTAFIPTISQTEGILSINHELVPGGVTMMDLAFNNHQKRWQRSNVSEIDFTGVVGTIANCSGAITPWNTLITCEEVTHPTDSNSDGYSDIGWAIEIDPISRTIVNGQKLWAMGNFKHENAVVHPNRRTVYQGADAQVGYLFKFVADSIENLHSGKLYVYKGSKSGTGQWHLLKNSTPDECNQTNYQCDTLGATVFDGIEDVEINPIDGKVYFAVKGVGESCVYRFEDENPLGGGIVTNFIEYVGGADRNYTLHTEYGSVNENWGRGNDNLTFDQFGNLFVLQDGGDNHIWLVGANHSELSPDVKIFLRSPFGSEPTGMTFSPDYKFMFLSFQHPSSENIGSYLPDINGYKTYFNKDVAIVIAKNDTWSLGCRENISITESFPESCCYASSNTITSSRKIPSANHYQELYAPKSIELTSGFSSPYGSTFKAEIRNCEE